MSLYVDRIDFKHGNPDSRFETLASAAIADLGSSDHITNYSPGVLHVFSDYFSTGVFGVDGFDYGFTVMDDVLANCGHISIVEIIERFKGVGKISISSAVSILRIDEKDTPPYGPVQVIYQTCFLDLDRLHNNNEAELGEYIVSEIEARDYKVEDEQRIVDLIRDQALLKERITV